jgi:hypothetical protein
MMIYGAVLGVLIFDIFTKTETKENDR